MKNKTPKGMVRFSPEWWAFWTQVDPVTGCHVWQGAKCKLGYGRMWYEGRGGRPAQRVRFEREFGPIPDGGTICHRCDNPTCVNPAHLFLGTQLDNMRDMFAKHRGRPRGRPFGWRKQPLQLDIPDSRATRISTPAIMNTHTNCRIGAHSTSYENQRDTGAVTPQQRRVSND